MDHQGRDAEAIVRQVRDAMTNRTTVELPLADDQGRAVSVFVNGATVSCLVLDLDEGPRPSEMS
jgi:hypothetical protein